MPWSAHASNDIKKTNVQKASKANPPGGSVSLVIDLSLLSSRRRSPLAALLETNPAGCSLARSGRRLCNITKRPIGLITSTCLHKQVPTSVTNSTAVDIHELCVCIPSHAHLLYKYTTHEQAASSKEQVYTETNLQPITAQLLLLQALLCTHRRSCQRL